MNLKILFNNLFSFSPGGEIAIFFILLLLTFLLGMLSYVIIFQRPASKVNSKINESKWNDKLSAVQKALEKSRNEHKNLEVKFMTREEQFLMNQISNKDSHVLIELANQSLEQNLKILTTEKNNIKEELSKLKIILAEKSKTEAELNQKIIDLTQKNSHREFYLHELETKVSESVNKELQLIQSHEEVNKNLAVAILQIEKLNREIEMLNVVIESKEQLLQEKKNLNS